MTQEKPVELCEDCPPIGCPTDKTRCDQCPRRFTPVPEGSTVRIGFDPKTREVLYAKVEKPVKYAVNGRPVTLGEFYEGHGPDDPSGRYYVYDDSPHVTHWMSTGSMVIRCTPIEDNKQ